jgi:hypothetical protein
VVLPAAHACGIGAPSGIAMKRGVLFDRSLRA